MWKYTNRNITSYLIFSVAPSATKPKIWNGPHLVMDIADAYKCP